MTRTITVKGRTGLFDTPFFLLAENEPLTVEFKFPDEIRAGRYYVLVRHGNAPKKTFVLSSDKHIELSADWLNSGGTEPVEFELQLRNLNGTVVIRSDYHVEALLITPAEGTWTATAEMQKLETKLRELESTFKKKLEALEAALAKEIEAKEKILAKFTDYIDNGAELFPEELK